MTLIQAVAIVGCCAWLGGCASTSTSSSMAVVKLTDGGARMAILGSLDAGKQCALLGVVKAYPPYILPDDFRNTLRNKAAELGADAIFVTNFLIAPATANAYRCAPAQPAGARAR